MRRTTMRSLKLLVVLDRFEQRAALAAAVLKRHRLGPEERDDLGVALRAVRAARLGAGLRVSASFACWSQTSSPRARAASRRCARRSRRACSAGGPDPKPSSRCWSVGRLRSRASPRAALRSSVGPMLSWPSLWKCSRLAVGRPEPLDRFLPRVVQRAGVDARLEPAPAVEEVIALLHEHLAQPVLQHLDRAVDAGLDHHRERGVEDRVRGHELRPLGPGLVEVGKGAAGLPDRFRARVRAGRRRAVRGSRTGRGCGRGRRVPSPRRRCRLRATARASPTRRSAARASACCRRC